MFWKIGCQNTSLLIWEEFYYEPMLNSVPPSIPGIESTELSSREWEGCRTSEIRCSQLENQVSDSVNLLINKMMINTRINHVGEGLVGRAAFTGNHQWILSNSYIRDAHPPEVLNEVHLQFSAGMQTVAVIPVLPHGVVQLASSLTIMENLGFVNDVKSLILQLGCVPGALLSENYGVKESQDKIRAPVSLGIPVTMDSSGIYKAVNSTPLMMDNCNQLVNSFQPSPQVSQFSLVRQVRDDPRFSPLRFQAPSLVHTLAKPNNYCNTKMIQMMKSKLPSRGLPETSTVGAEVIPSNPDAWLNQLGPSNSRCGLSSQPLIGQSDGESSLKVIEQQIFSDAGFWEHGCNTTNQENILITFQTKRNEGLISNSHIGSVSTLLLGRSKLHDGSNSEVGKIHPQMQKAEDINVAGSAIQNLGSSKPGELLLSKLAGKSVVNPGLSGQFGQGHDSTDKKQICGDLAPKKERMDNDLFQALNIQSINHNEHLPLREHFPGYIHNCLMGENGTMSPRFRDAKWGDTRTQSSSGDDLFAILGADFKSKLLNDNWNSLLVDGQETRTENLSQEISTLVNIQGADTDLYAVDGGISNSGMFSGLGMDHLLDAVVSGAQSVSVAKQISDDTVSCRTALTKISSSSIPSCSLSCGQVNESDNLQGELISLPKSLAKAGRLGSGSLGPQFTKDDTGTCSQTSIYGSQINSWVEQGHNVKRESSVSTAYSKRNDEPTKPNRKRLKPGENPRPRPKDRQMIQDRVKELREIVPNGAKCSIDALLERTIKHMLFLQSVTKHADKLKQTGESKIINKEGGLLLKDSFEGGATWAYEVGSQSMLCPIIVEDLNPPRQMLVEMLCEERGLFLEIADLIRGLGLTILKGVLEARNDKIWARFAVEANRDVTRMEIFMSLVHLLEQTMKDSASPGNALDGNNIMVKQHSFPQATSIPATGRASSLQ